MGVANLLTTSSLSVREFGNADIITVPQNFFLSSFIPKKGHKLGFF